LDNLLGICCHLMLNLLGMLTNDTTQENWKEKSLVLLPWSSWGFQTNCEKFNIFKREINSWAVLREIWTYLLSIKAKLGCSLMMQDQKIEKRKEKKKKTLVLISWWGYQTICRGGDSAFSRERLTSISEQFAKDSAWERDTERERDSSAFQNNL